ncbi:hypothetical protein LX36DRAFT_48095 [Colletotrichum falcatum]|nr:hypothetical protein LX36DRAFT_48095 [Colletotrichum falcatum]
MLTRKLVRAPTRLHRTQTYCIDKSRATQLSGAFDLTHVWYRSTKGCNTNPVPLLDPVSSSRCVVYTSGPTLGRSAWRLDTGRAYDCACQPKSEARQCSRVCRDDGLIYAALGRPGNSGTRRTGSGRPRGWGDGLFGFAIRQISVQRGDMRVAAKCDLSTCNTTSGVIPAVLLPWTPGSTTI